MIYFDNSATTSVHPEVVEAMLPYLHEIFGNPSSKYYGQAEKAKKAVENARAQVALLLGCDPDEVVFTSGSTESNNMILKGVTDYYQSKGHHIVTTKAEHPSILETANYLESKGSVVTYLEVDRFGRIDLSQVEELVHADAKPVLISTIWGNNEVGSLNDVAAIAKLCRANDVFFHTDATQVVGKIEPIQAKEASIDFLSCSAHKLHGPKGIGACMIKKHDLGYKTKITPLLHGGEQENEYRSGTLSVHNIVGFGKAAELARIHLEDTRKKLLHLEQYFATKITAAFPGIVYFNNDTANKIPGILNIRFQGVNNELLIRKIADHVALSTGSACSSSKPSHVLKSMGMSNDEIRSSVRVSLSSKNTEEEIDTFLNLLKG